FPLAMNILSSDRRVELAIGEAPGALGHELLNLAEQLMPPKPKGLWSAAKPMSSRLFGARVQRKSTGRRSAEPDLSSLPILQTWPDDAGKFITLPQVFTYDPATHKRNVGMYRMQVFGARETGMHWQIQKGGGFHYTQAEAQNNPL